MRLVIGINDANAVLQSVPKLAIFSKRVNRNFCVVSFASYAKVEIRIIIGSHGLTHELSRSASVSQSRAGTRP